MSGIKSVIFNEIIKYAQDDFSTAKDRKKLVDNIFSKLDTNKDMQLSDKDGMNDFYKRHFGIELSDKPITQDDLLETIDDIAVEMSFEDAPESDFSENYLKMIKEAAFSEGTFVYNMLDKLTIGPDYRDINSILTKITKETVISFLEGFYSKGDSEGIIEFLDDEWDGDEISMDGKKNLIRTFLEKAKENNLENTIYYNRINRILNDYDENKKDAKNFNTWHWFTRDNEIIDEAMKELYNKIKEQEKEQN